MPPTVALSFSDCVSGVYDLCPAPLLTLAPLFLTLLLTPALPRIVSSPAEATSSGFGD